MKSKPIWRLITAVAEHRNAGFHKSRFVGGSYRLTLECGHESRRKLSAGLPIRGVIRCLECERRRAGVRCTLSQPDGSKLVETWDAASGMPKREVIRA